MTRKSWNSLGNRVRLKSVGSTTSTVDSPNHSQSMYNSNNNKKNMVTLNNPEIIQQQQQYLPHTVQVDHETLSRLKDASDIMGDCPTYTEVLDTILSHYLNCNNVERTYHYTPTTYKSLP